jgi:hypothetical protein
MVCRVVVVSLVPASAALPLSAIVDGPLDDEPVPLGVFDPAIAVGACGAVVVLGPP